jgi:hypothetical protein
MSIRIVGPREVRTLGRDTVCVDTTSHSREVWSHGLSPFHLGPVPLYGGHKARVMENAWQFSKVYAQHLDADGDPSEDYWAWAHAGWTNGRAQRYPMGKGAKPAYCFWNGAKLGYIDARLQVYFLLYRNAVVCSEAFSKLEDLYRDAGEIALFDFDGYDHEKAGMSLTDVMNFERRPMGHSVVLKILLLYGRDATPARVLERERAMVPARDDGPQPGLF